MSSISDGWNTSFLRRECILNPLRVCSSSTSAMVSPSFDIPSRNSVILRKSIERPNDYSFPPISSPMLHLPKWLSSTTARHIPPMTTPLQRNGPLDFY